MTVSVTILDSFKSKVAYQVADTDANIFDLGISPALLAADWTVYDAAADAAGYQTVTANVPVLAADNAITTIGTYYFKIATDGGAITEYNVVIGGATTFTALAAAMDTAWAGGTVAFDDVNDRFVFTSGSFGLSSSVSVTAGTTGMDVFVRIALDNLPVTGFTYNTPVGGTVAVAFTNVLASGASQGYAAVDVGAAVTGASATGLSNTAAVYQATVTIDGVASLVQVTGSAAQTYTTLLAEINTDLPGTPAFLVNGDLRMTSPTFGSTSTVAVTNGPAVAGYQTLTSDVAVVAGNTAILAASAGTYYFKVNTDGAGIVEYSIVVPASNQSYTAIAVLLDAAWTLGTVTFDDANDRFLFTSGTTGITSSVSVTAGTTGTDVFAQIVTDGTPTMFTTNAAVPGIGSLFPALTGFASISTVPGSGVGDAAAYQVVDVGSNKVGASTTGLSNATAGYQEAVFVYQKVGTDSTGLANDATAYTATATIDGVARAVSVVGSAAQTFTTLVTELNTDLGAWATVTLTDGRIKVTSLATGASSTVVLTNTGTYQLFPSLSGFYLFAASVAGTAPVYTFNVVFDNGVVRGYQTVDVGGAQTLSSATNLVSVTTYTATITVDGVGHAISILGSTAQTYGTLIAQIEADLAQSADVGLVSGNLRVISRSTGAVSTVAITAGTLFAGPLAGFVSVVAAVPGVVKAVSVVGSAALTYTTLLSEINTDLGVAGTATLVGGNLRITSSNAVPGNSNVNILSAGNMLTRGGPLTDCEGINQTIGGTEDSSATIIYVVSRRGGSLFSYQEFVTWDIALNTGTLPGVLFFFRRNATADSAMYVYTAGSGGDPLVIG